MDVCEIIYPDKNHDGFWTNEKLVEQISHFVHCDIRRSESEQLMVFFDELE